MSRKRVLLMWPMLDPVGEELLGAEVDVVRGWELDPGDYGQALAGAHGLGGGGTLNDIDRGSQLVVIASYGSGYENVDVGAATAAGIAVVNAAGSQYSAVTEHAIGMMLSFAKRIAYADRIMHTERRFIPRQAFSRADWPGWPTQLRGKTLGIIGFGFIGRDLAEKCRLAFDMDVVVYSPRFDPEEAARQRVRLVDSMDEVLAGSDYLSLSVPLTPETTGMIGAHELARMKPGAVIMNLSRGPTIDTEALVGALRAGQLAGALLDVFEPEPLPDGHPLYDFDNVVLTPHIAGWVAESMPALTRTTAREILRALRGEKPWRLVNPEVWPNRRRVS